jgi:hypothetical protein
MGINLDTQAMRDAFVVAKSLGITGKGPRERRPTLDELDLLLDYFQSRFKVHPESIPMHMITAFAIFSTRRQEEICRIVRPDLDAGGSRVMVRDMKNPGEMIGNDVWCDLPAPALQLLQAMPKTAPEFFPYNHRSVSARFTRACKVLGIEDLHCRNAR